MKIPTYRHQTGLPKQASAQFLSVQADAGKLGAPGAAQAQFGSVGETEGLKWFGHLLTTERATKQTTAEYEFGTALNQSIVNTQQQNPAEAWEGRGATDQRAFVENSLQREAQKQALGISDSVVRRRFLTSTSKSIAAAMPTIATNLHNNYRDHSEAEWIKRQNQVVRTIASMPYETAGEHNLRDLAVKDMVDSLRFTGETRGWAPEKTEKAIVDALSSIDYYKARTDLATAIGGGPDGTGDPEALVEQFLENLRTTRYKHLDVGKAGSIETSAQRSLANLTSKKIAAEEAAERKKEQALDWAQDEKFETISNEIDLARHYFSRGEEPPADLTVWSLPELMNMDPLLQRKLKPGQKKALIQQLTGADKINNPQVLGEYERRITDAFSEEELDAVEADLRHIYLDSPTPVPILGSKAYNDLTTHIKGVRGSTPAAAEKKKYGDRVTHMLRSSGVLTLGFTKDLVEADDKAVVGVMAEEYYWNRVAEGVRPAEAFYETIKEYVHPERSEQLTYSVFQSLPPDIKAVFGTVGPDNLANINRETIFKAWDAWDVYSKGGLPPEVVAAERGIPTREQLSQKQVEKLGLSVRERISTRALYATEQALNFLTDSEPGRMLKQIEAPAIVPNTGDPDADEAAQAEKDENWFDRNVRSTRDAINRGFDKTLQTLGVGDDSVADRAKKRGAGVN